MTETLVLKHYGFGKSLPDLTVKVEYRKTPYYDHDPSYVPTHRGTPQKAYDVYVDGVLTGRIQQIVASTDRHYNLIRVPGRGRIEWGWDRTHDAGPNPWGRMMHHPGLYGRTRAAAVADMLGYDAAEKVAL